MKWHVFTASFIIYPNCDIINIQLRLGTNVMHFYLATVIMKNTPRTLIENVSSLHFDN